MSKVVHHWTGPDHRGINLREYIECLQALVCVIYPCEDSVGFQVTHRCCRYSWCNESSGQAASKIYRSENVFAFRVKVPDNSP